MSREPADVVPHARGRLRLFRGRDAVSLNADTMVMAAPSEATQAGLRRLAQAGVVAGVGDRSRLLFREPGDSRFSLVHLWFKSGYVLLPHSHDGDCLYYVLAGSLRIGREWLGRGDGFFMPAEHAYTYEAGDEGVEVLEFRDKTRFGIDLKDDREGAWDRLIAVFGAREAAWKEERLPPSECQRSS